MTETDFQKIILSNLRGADCIAHKFGDAPRTTGQRDVRFTSIKYYDLYTILNPKYTGLNYGLYVGIEMKRYYPKKLKTKIESFSMDKIRFHQVKYLQDVDACHCPALIMIYIDSSKIDKEEAAYLIPATHFTLDTKLVYFNERRSIEYDELLSYPVIKRKMKDEYTSYKTKWDLSPLLNIRDWYDDLCSSR